MSYDVVDGWFAMCLAPLLASFIMLAYYHYRVEDWSPKDNGNNRDTQRVRSLGSSGDYGRPSKSVDVATKRGLSRNDKADA